MKRLFVAAEAKSMGRGGISCMSKISGMTRVTINAGIKELQNKVKTSAEPRIRQPGGGRKTLTEKTPGIIEALKNIVESTTRGDPESPLLWTCKSSRTVADELMTRGYKASHFSVATLLDDLGYSLQGNRKTLEGSKNLFKISTMLAIKR